MKTKLYTLLFAVAVSVTNLFADPVKIGDLYYELNATNRTAEVSAEWETGTYTLTSVDIPESVVYDNQTYSVTSIGVNAFAECSSLTTINIPNGITSIGEYAFGNCTSLSYVDIPNSVTNFDQLIFSGCSSLTTVVLPQNLSNIGLNTFFDCRSLTSIYNYATTPQAGYMEAFEFVDISACTLYVPEESISRYQSSTLWKDFGNILALPQKSYENVKIGELVYNLNNYIKTAEVTYEVQGSSANYPDLTNVTIPASVDYSDATYTVTKIGDWAFSNCMYLEEVTIPNSVTSIGDDAFYYCQRLSSFTLPNSVTSIGSNALGGCGWLTSIMVEDGNSTYDSRDNCNAIIETSTNKIIAGCLSTIIPNTVTIIGASAFEYCSQLTQITIPASVTDLEADAFYGCINLASITCEAITPPTHSQSNIFGNVDKSIPLYVPAASVAAYQTAEYWSEFTNIQPIHTNIRIGDLYYNLDADSQTAEVTSTHDGQYAGDITIPSTVSYDGITYNVTSIGERAFYGCNVMMSVTIPNSVTSIGNTAFWGCSNLMSVELSDNVTSIGDGAFAECTSMTSITIGKSVTSIGISAFWQCYVLNITCKAVVPPAVDAQTFEGANKTMVLYVPAQSVATYQVTDGWKDFAGIQAIPGTEGTSTTPMFPGDPGTITYKLQLGAAVLGGDSLPDYTPEGAGGYAVGTSVTITAQDIPGYQFVQWSDSVTDKSRSIVIEQSTSLTAYYSHSQIEIAVAANAWTFFCLPSVGKPYSEEMFEYVGLTNVKWGTYNGGTRAAGKSGWETPESFNAQQGYIIYSTTAGTLRINASETDLPSGDVSVSLANHSSSQPENAGWNFLGNPYSQGYNIAGLAAAGIESPITVWNGTGYDTYTPGIDTYILQPFEAFFIQKAEGGVESVNFSPELANGINVVDEYGTLPGYFSVSATTKVQFSKGNLQYQASTDTWRFAENQYDTITSSNVYISETYSGWIDLFSWGTGDNPTKSTTDYYDESTFVDWGVNAISNGGNQPNLWRTLSNDEWGYLFNSRSKASSLLGRAIINGTNGMILLPDDWTGSDVAFSTGTSGYFSQNIYTIEEWKVLEAAGAVFLPAAGERNGTQLLNVGTVADYWSTTQYEERYGYMVHVQTNTLNPQSHTFRYTGLSVRLVR